MIRLTEITEDNWLEAADLSVGQSQRGYGSAALKLVLDELKKEGHYDHVEVCVKKDDAAAIGLYEKHGFADSGYFDEDAPDSQNMICCFAEGGAK